jgi:hypothetical protein
VSGALARALEEAGGQSAPPELNARLRRLLLDELRAGAAELAATRSGYESPVVVAIAAIGGRLAGVAPVDPGVRADPGRVSERAWLLSAALVGALCETGDEARDEPALEAGAYERDWLALSVPASDGDPELAVLAFEEHVRQVNRLRARALALPGHVLDRIEDLRRPLAPDSQLRVAEAIARLGGRPADERSSDELEDAVLARLGAGPAPARPHDDPDPARRVARRIVQRMAGMGKWGGYHTAFDHLARGFEGNERRLAQDVGERLIAAGLLVEKLSVGQRHVFLNPRRAGDVHALIEGTVPPGVDLGQ